MNKRHIYAVAVAASLSVVALAVALPASAKSHPAAVRAAAFALPTPTAALRAPVLFVRGNAKLYNPDGIVVTKNAVFVNFQGQSDHLPGPSTIVKYDRATAKVLGSVAITGRCDGLRLNPSTGLLWAVFNNDGLNGSPKRQPLLYTIDPASLAANLYEFPPLQPHGGGYDDIAFVNGRAFLSASSPTLNAKGVNDKAIIVTATLTNAGRVNIAPIIDGDSSAYNLNLKTYGPMNFTDPDSLAVDSGGDLVLVGDNNQQLLVIKNPGVIGAQKATVATYGTQFDDVAWTSGTAGTLWIADTLQNAVYSVAASYAQGTVFAEGPDGIPVQSFIGTVGAGEIVTPLLTQTDGVFGPTSLIFVPSGS